MDKYQQYQTEDFLQDESFISWVLDPDIPGGQSWQAWMNANPGKREVAQKAVEIIRSLDFKKETVDDNFYVSLKQRIDRTIVNKNATTPKVRSFASIWMKVAAGIAALVICIAVLYSVRKPSYTFISTPYAAIKTVWLPDSSEVILNANSSVRFNRKTTDGKREVWVTGEAFFKVRHIDIAGKAQPFEVHAGDAVIEVLGTEFNVKNINNTTGVLLRQGKVRFGVPASHAETIMQPNDYCLYDAAQGKIITRVANPVLFTSWLEHKYRFENATVTEICETLKAYYGYNFVIRNGNLDIQTFSGTLELQNEQVMMTVLGELFKTKVVKQNDEVIIE